LRLGFAEQQVQGWEANDYAGVSVERMQEIADALGVRITETIRFRPAGKSAWSTAASTAARVRSGRGSRAA
jgi:hypothetical protein